MSLEGTPTSLPVSEDFGLAGHLASIDRMHREALTQLEALVQPWGNLWSPPQAVAGSPAEGQPSQGQPQPQPQEYGAHAAAA